MKLILILLILTFGLHAEREKIKISLVISGGVSLGAYESGYNWAWIKMINGVKADKHFAEPDLRSIAGASAGAINATLSAMYWCQKSSIPLKNSVDDNLFYETWVKLDIDDLQIKGDDPENKSTLFSQKVLREKGQKIIEHMNQPIYRKNCEVPLGIAVTKVVPIVETIGTLKMKNQHFSIPLTFKEKNGKAIVENRTMPPSEEFYISIPNIDKEKRKLVDVLLASSAFPGAFPQVKLNYTYKDETRSHYFMDGGIYDNVPLDLVVNLDSEASLFFFLDPGNIRKKKIIKKKEEKEEVPLGFIYTNLNPLLSSAEIYQSMMLYKAFNKHIRYNPKRMLMLSSRYHPITGEFLSHFGAFLDLNFRVYDYYVGIYDAIYRVASMFKKREHYANLSQIEIMNMLKTKLGLDENPEALAAYNLLLNAEFHHIVPKTKDRFSAIYNAFNMKQPDDKRYDVAEFKAFLLKLDLKYLKKTRGEKRIAYAKKDIDSWYKKPLRYIVTRITTLENSRAEVYPAHRDVATAINALAWAGTTLVKEKRGLKVVPFDVPEDKGKDGLRTVLRLLPNELSADIKNGGLSVGYNAMYYTNTGLIDGIEAKASYIVSHKAPDFVRADLGIFTQYSDFMKLGVGASFFGDMEGAFYKKETAYGLNTYVDVMDIFRLTYVRRYGDMPNNDYIYFGIENIPSLIYWLNR